MIPFYGFDSENRAVIIIGTSCGVLIYDLKKQKEREVGTYTSSLYHRVYEFDCEKCGRNSIASHPIEVFPKRSEIIFAIGKTL